MYLPDDKPVDGIAGCSQDQQAYDNLGQAAFDEFDSDKQEYKHDNCGDDPGCYIHCLPPVASVLYNNYNSF
jgi:hypothetical protein